MHKIREMDKKFDWTSKETDENLLHHCNRIITESKMLEKECKKFNFYYFDTFSDRQNTLNKIVDLVESLQ